MRLQSEDSNQKLRGNLNNSLEVEKINEDMELKLDDSVDQKSEDVNEPQEESK